MQSEQEKSKSTSRVANGDESNPTTTQSESHMPQNGEGEQGAAHGEGVPSESKPAHDEGEGGGQQGQFQYPEQRHSGKVDGVGPEFGAFNHVSVFERLEGLKEEIKGSIMHKPEVKQHGKDLISGESKRREKEKQDKGGAFKNAGGGGSEEKIPDKTEKEGSSATKEYQNRDKSSTALSNTKDTKDVDKQQGAAAGVSEEPHAHPTEV